MDLRDTESITGIYLYRALLDHTQLTVDQFGEAVGEELVGEWAEAKEAYLALKNNFEQIGRYADASWAYRKERRMEKRETCRLAKDAFQERRWGSGFRKSIKVAGDLLVEFVCDYGEGIWQVIRAMLIVWILFAFLCGTTWGVLGPEEWVGTELRRSPTRHPVDMLLFSIGVTSRMPAGLKAQPIPVMRILMAVEAISGTVLAGLLGFVLGNRIRRS